jgi:Domain of unknown function (DUF4440)
MSDAELWQLERQFWKGDAEFFDQHLSPDALMVFPDPVGVMDRPRAVASVRATGRWQKVHITHKHELHPNDDTVVLVYFIDADRPDSAYTAQCSSTYVATRAGWQLAVHHQTPAECRIKG